MAAMAGAVAGCAIQPNAAPRDIPLDQRPDLDLAGANAVPATGSGRVFLVTTETDAPRLHSVQREAAAGGAVITALVEGPNPGELDAGLDSALPSALTVLSTRQSAGTFTVDLSDEILELNSAELGLAIAQIVFTASEIDGVRAVGIQVDGSSREWPNGQGELRSEPLTVYDFPGLAESSQPHYPPVPSPA